MAYTSKTNWIDGEVLKAEDLNRFEQGIGDIFTRLDTSKNTTVTLDPGTNTVTVLKDSLFNLSGLTGRTLLNLLGRDGNFESLAGWTFTGGSGALDPSNKVYGSNAVRMTLSASAGTISKSIPVVAGKKYLLVGDLKNGTANNAKIYATGVNGTLVTSTSSFQTSYLLFAASSTANLTMGISVSGASGQVIYADGLRLYELSEADYNAASKMNTTGIVARYPYTEGLAGTKNPYAIRWLDDNKMDVAALLAFDTELLSSPIGSDSDTLIKGSDGHYYKNTLWRKLQLDGGQAWASSSDGNRNGYKKVYMTIAGMADPVYTIKYNGDLISRAAGDVSDYGANKIYVNTINGVVEYSIATADSGWGDSYMPTVNEIKAYFYGWKMYDYNNGNGISIYNAQSGQVKGWCRRIPSADPSQSSSYAEGTQILPVTQAAGWTSYELMYKRTQVNVEPIPSEGALNLVQGDNIVEVGSGLVLREKANSYKNASNGYAVINNLDTSSSWLRYKAQRLIDVYRNGISDPGWSRPQDAYGYGLDRAFNFFFNVSDSDVYTVTYIRADKFPTAPITGTTPNNERSILDNLIRDIQQTTRRVSIVENRKVEKGTTYPWLTLTLINGATPYTGSSDYRQGLYVRKKENMLELSGLITNVPSGVIVARLPVELRPLFSSTVPVTYENNSSSNAYIFRLKVSVDGGISITFTTSADSLWVSVSCIVPLD